jgi:DNA-binding NtrC family response regulator
MAAAGKGVSTRVLVVDDDASIRLLCRVNLELDGHEVVEAGSLGEARGHLDEERFDVVMLDVHLGGETSGELVVECHAQEPPIPVVLVTGSAEALEEREPGADAVLPKPFEPQALVATVRNLADVPAQR